MAEDINEYYRKANDQKIDQLISDVREIKKDVEKLLAFRMMLIGLSSMVAAAVSIAIELIKR